MGLPEESGPAPGHGASEWPSGTRNLVPRHSVLRAALTRALPGNPALPLRLEAQCAAGTRPRSGWAAVSLSHHGPGRHHRTRSAWLSSSNASLGTGIVSGRKEDLLFVAVLKRKGGSHKHILPLARGAHWRWSKCFQPKPVRVHSLPDCIS